MTAYPRRHWRDNESWTGFVFLLVPTPGSPVNSERLFAKVKRLVKRDVEMADIATIARALPIGSGPRRDAALVARALHRAAVAPGYVFAPRLVFGCVLIASDERRARAMVQALADTPDLEDLPVYFFVVVADPERPDTAEPSQRTVTAVADALTEMIDSFQTLPNFAITEEQFLSRGRKPAPAGLALSGPSPAGPAPAAPRNAGPVERIAPGEQRALPAGPVVPHQAHVAAETAPVDAGRGGARRPAGFGTRLRRAVVTLPARLRPWERPPTPSETLDRVARSAGTVELLYAVLVADRTRTPSDRRHAALTDIDRQLATLTTDGRCSIDTAVFTAGRRLVRHDPLRPAGTLGRARLPRVPTEHFDLIDCVEDLEKHRRRAVAALRRRRLPGARVHVCVLSTALPLADMGSVDAIVELCRVVDATWIVFDTDPALMSTEFLDAGLHVLEDHDDVAGEYVAHAFGRGWLDGAGEQPMG